MELEQMSSCELLSHLNETRWPGSMQHEQHDYFFRVLYYYYNLYVEHTSRSRYLFLNNRNSISHFCIWFLQHRHWHVLFLSVLIIQVGFSRHGLQCYWITFVLGLLWETTSGLTACSDTEALMTFPTQSRPTTHLSSTPFCNPEI